LPDITQETGGKSYIPDAIFFFYSNDSRRFQPDGGTEGFRGGSCCATTAKAKWATVVVVTTLVCPVTLINGK